MVIAELRPQGTGRATESAVATVAGAKLVGQCSFFSLMPLREVKGKQSLGFDGFRKVAGFHLASAFLLLAECYFPLNFYLINLVLRVF